MQNIDLKKIAFFLMAWFLLISSAYSQNTTFQVAEADSLFINQQFSQALQLYERVFYQSGKVSPAMLLKMAYIEEGTGNYTKALYYLSLYYIQRPNLQVVNKMKEIATTYNLQGYEYKDVDFFMTLYQRYYIYFSLVVLAISIIWLASLVARKIRREYLPARHLMGCLTFLIMVFLFLNIKRTDQQAIIAQDNVYLMSAPSAGGNLVYIAQKGHRLDVEATQDIWVQVVWNGKPAFVRKQNVLLVE
jgi:tetratricopeptide (TPR) repeat protein